MTETRKTTTPDPTDVANDMIERSTAAAKAYTAAASAATIAGLRTAFDLQNGLIEASRGVVDAAVAANAKFADQAVGMVKAHQAETTKLVAASTKLFNDSLQTKI